MFLLLSACGAGQYIAIPGAWVDTEDVLDSTSATTQAPTVTVVEGSSDLTLGESVTLNISFVAVTEIVIDQVTIFIAPLPDLWIYELSEDEVAAGSVDIEIQAVESEPPASSCEMNTKYGQNGWCAEPAASGTTEAVVWAQNEETNSTGTPFALTLPALDSGTSDACTSFTLDDCCGGSTGISAVSCAIDPACGCPDGTGGGDIGGDGYRQCTCPA
jgi:hypothetical protein